MLKLLGSTWHPSKVSPESKFKLRGLTGLEYMEFQHLVRSEISQEALAQIDPFSRTKEQRDSGDAYRMPELNRKVCDYVVQCGVLDWEGVGDEDGNPLACTQEAKAALPYINVAELVSEILLRSNLDEDQAKNLSSQSRSTTSPSASTATTANGADTATSKTPPPDSSSQSPASSNRAPVSSPCQPRKLGG